MPRALPGPWRQREATHSEKGSHGTHVKLGEAGKNKPTHKRAKSPELWVHAEKKTRPEGMVDTDEQGGVAVQPGNLGRPF